MPSFPILCIAHAPLPNVRACGQQAHVRRTFLLSLHPSTLGRQSTSAPTAPAPGTLALAAAYPALGPVLQKKVVRPLFPTQPAPSQPASQPADSSRPIEGAIQLVDLLDLGAGTTAARRRRRSGARRGRGPARSLVEAGDDGVADGLQLLEPVCGGGRRGGWMVSKGPIRDEVAGASAPQRNTDMHSAAAAAAARVWPASRPARQSCMCAHCHANVQPRT